MPTLMTARMTNPAFAVPGAMETLQALSKTISRARVPINHELLHLRASQINGCSVCVDMHAKSARRAGESEERVFAVAAWREAPYFSDAERAALALTEAVTRVADSAEPVPDRDLGRRRRALRRGAARRARARHRADQPVEPPQRRHPAGGRRVGRVSPAQRVHSPVQGVAPRRPAPAAITRAPARTRRAGSTTRRAPRSSTRRLALRHAGSADSPRGSPPTPPGVRARSCRGS
jgi:AhpD family alkylhydroperoxidase